MYAKCAQQLQDVSVANEQARCNFRWTQFGNHKKRKIGWSCFKIGLTRMEPDIVTVFGGYLT